MSEAFGEWEATDATATVVRKDSLEEPDGASHPLDVAELYYATLPDFVAGFLAPTYRRSLGAHSSTWCPEWWRHAEGIARLEALWRAWEHLRLDATTGMSVWFRDHADHHMAVLLHSDGPFKGCSPEGGHRARELPALALVEPPDGLFTP